MAGAAADPVFAIIDVNVKADVLPTEAYVAVEETFDVRIPAGAVPAGPIVYSHLIISYTPHTTPSI